ncbi:hypothetical protein AHAS_Ahas12G0242300 [Arachis hypogaea]
MPLLTAHFAVFTNSQYSTTLPDAQSESPLLMSKTCISEFRIRNGSTHPSEIRFTSSSAFFRSLRNLCLFHLQPLTEEAESYFDSIPKYLRAAECYSSLLNCYAQVRDVDKAERIMLQMKHLGFARSTLARNSLLNLYYQTQDYDKVENLLLEMKEEGIKFDRFTFSTLINTYAAKSDIEGIDKLLAQLEDDPSYSQHADWWSVYAVAANCYGKLGLHDKAFNALKKSEERLSSTLWKEAFPYLVTQYATIGKKEEVMSLGPINVGEWFTKKADSELVCFIYHSVKFSKMLRFKIDRRKEAESYFDSIPKYSRAAECYSSLLNCYAQVRDVDKAERIMLQMKHLGFARSTLARNSLLNLYYQTQNYDKVENLLLEMKEEDIKFDRFTLATLINTYAAKSDIEGIDKLLAQLEDDPSYSRHVDWWSVYAVAANWYGKLGLHDKAFNALKKSEKRLSYTIWNEAFPYLMTQYAAIGKKEEVMRWEVFKQQMKDMLHHSDQKGIELKKPGASLYTFPMPDCMCKQEEARSRNCSSRKCTMF